MRHLPALAVALTAAALLAFGLRGGGGAFPAPPYFVDGVRWDQPEPRPGVEIRNGRLVFARGTTLVLDGTVLVRAGDHAAAAADRLHRLDPLWNADGMDPMRGGRPFLRRYLDEPEQDDVHWSGRALYLHEEKGRVTGITLDYESALCGSTGTYSPISLAHSSSTIRSSPFLR